jgi:hypothetical protein
MGGDVQGTSRRGSDGGPARAGVGHMSRPSDVMNSSGTSAFLRPEMAK